MNKLDQIISELCPDGVEYKILNTVCDVYDGTHTTPKYTDSGVKFASVENIDDDSTLNLRREPSPAAEILMRLFRHQKLIVLENAEVNGWARVKTDAVEGYVMISFLQKIK